MAKSDKKAKLKKEIEEIKKLKYINNIMKRADVENALLSNPSPESETVSESRIDTLIESMDEENRKGEFEGLEAIESMTLSTHTQKPRIASRKKSAKPKHVKRPKSRSRGR